MKLCYKKFGIFEFCSKNIAILLLFITLSYLEVFFLYTLIYRVVGNWWYKRKGGDCTRKKKSEIQNKNFSFEALFLRKLTLNFRSVRVHFMAWGHIKSIVYSEEITNCEQLKEKIIVAFHTLKRSNTLESVHRNLIRRAEVCVGQNGQHFQQFL